MNILIIGQCGVGKTWVMKRVIEEFNLTENFSIGKIKYKTNGEINVIGKYVGHTFDGSDRLSMSAITDLKDFHEYNKNRINIAEGDRFTNSRFIKEMNPKIILIEGDGKDGRDRRGSSQSDRHLKSIKTRVENIKPHISAKNSKECFNIILNIIKNEKD